MTEAVLSALYAFTGNFFIIYEVLLRDKALSMFASSVIYSESSLRIYTVLSLLTNVKWMRFSLEPTMPLPLSLMDLTVEPSNRSLPNTESGISKYTLPSFRCTVMKPSAFFCSFLNSFSYLLGVFTVSTFSVSAFFFLNGQIAISEAPAGVCASNASAIPIHIVVCLVIFCYLNVGAMAVISPNPDSVPLLIIVKRPVLMLKGLI